MALSSFFQLHFVKNYLNLQKHCSVDVAFEILLDPYIFTDLFDVVILKQCQKERRLMLEPGTNQMVRILNFCVIINPQSRNMITNCGKMCLCLSLVVSRYVLQFLLLLVPTPYVSFFHIWLVIAAQLSMNDIEC